MHQSIPAAPIPPRTAARHLRTLSVPWSGISLQRGYPGFLTHVVFDSKYKHGGIYRKRPAVCHRLAVCRQVDKIVEVSKGMFPRFYAFFLLLIKPQLELSLSQLHTVAISGKFNVNSYFAFKTNATTSRGWGIFPLFSSPPPGICHPKPINANARGLAPPPGGEWAQLELTDALV